MMPFVFCSESIWDVDKGDYKHFVNSIQWHCTILMKTTRTLTGLSGEYVTFDQNVSNAVRIRSSIITAEQENLRF